MNKTIILPLVFLAVLLYGSTSAEKVQKNNINKQHLEAKVLKDIPYGPTHRQKLDIFLPDERTIKTKVVLLIPGGGWTGGDKSGFEYNAKVFQDSGVAAFTINYRYASLKDSITYIEILADIDSAVSFIVSKADEYVYDASHICLYGHSAGAHLALLFAYRKKNSRVNNVVSLAGATDLLDTAMLNMPTGIKDRLDIVVGGQDVRKWEDASPVYHLCSVTTYLYHGDADEIIPYRQSVELYEKIKDRNPRNRLVIIEGGGHAFNMKDNLRTIRETLSLINNRD